MPTIPIIAVPALVALIFKVALLAYSARSPAKNRTTRLFLALLVVLALHNLDEVLLLQSYVQQGLTYSVTFYGYAYIALLIPAIALILHVSLRVAYDAPIKFVALLYVPAAFLLFLLLGTDLLVVGFQPFKNTVLRVPGRLYSLFETYLVVYFLAALVNLICGARAARTLAINRTRCQWWLVGIGPTIFLLIYLIIANHFGLAKLSSTIYVPITWTIFLVITTIATYKYRLFDIQFFIPWSKVRKRKTAFYQRIQDMIGALAALRSVGDILQRVSNILHCQTALVGNTRPVVAIPAGQDAVVPQELRFSEFPLDVLKKVNHIVVAQEIAERYPELHKLMSRYHVGVIVPFNNSNRGTQHWMLLGERFSEQVYTPLDFQMVESLFAAMADRFLDRTAALEKRIKFLEDQLGTVLKMNRDLEIDMTGLRDYNRRLLQQKYPALISEKDKRRTERLGKIVPFPTNDGALLTNEPLDLAEDSQHRDDPNLSPAALMTELAWAREELGKSKQENALLKEELRSTHRTALAHINENESLRQQLAEAERGQIEAVDTGLPPEIASGKMGFNQYIAQTEEQILRNALRLNHGDIRRTMTALKMTDLQTFYYLIHLHGIDPLEYR